MPPLAVMRERTGNGSQKQCKHGTEMFTAHQGARMITAHMLQTLKAIFPFIFAAT